MVRNKLFHVPVKRNMLFKTEPLMGTTVPQVNNKEPIFKAGTMLERNKRSTTKKRNVSNWALKFNISA